MGLDLRWPIGLMFTIIGVLLTLSGLIAGSDPKALDININLWWGLVLLAFGAFMLVMARKGARLTEGPTAAQKTAAKIVNPPER